MGDTRPPFERWAAALDDGAGDLSCACSRFVQAQVEIEGEDWRPSPELRQRVERLERHAHILCAHLEREFHEIARQAYAEAAAQGLHPHHELGTNLAVFPPADMEYIQINFRVGDDGSVKIEETTEREPDGNSI